MAWHQHIYVMFNILHPLKFAPLCHPGFHARGLLTPYMVMGPLLLQAQGSGMSSLYRFGFLTLLIGLKGSLTPTYLGG